MGEFKKAAVDDQIRTRQRSDSWVNTVTQLGGALDRLRANTHTSSQIKSFAYYEDLLADDPLAHRVAHLPARETMRQGFKLDFGNDGPTELKPEIMADFDRLDGAATFIRAMTLARGTGGAAVFIGADDGQDLAMPLDLTRLKRIRYLKVLTATDLAPRTWYQDDQSDKYGDTETFDVTLTTQAPNGQTQMLLVHETRLIRFDGTVTTDRRRARNHGWGDSIFVQLEDRIADFWSAAQGLGNVLSDADQAVFKLKGLNDIIKASAEGTAAVQTKLAILQHGRSVARAIAVDADTEDFTYSSRSFTGYDSGLHALMEVVSMACGIPVTLLFGMSPGGMNATGESDVRFFYDAVKGDQQMVVMPRLRQLLTAIMAQREGPAKGRVPEHWSITFVPLMQSSPTERADIRLKTAQADEIEINAGIITPGESARSHYGGDEYTQDITLDPTRDLDEPLETPAERAAAKTAEAAAKMPAKGPGNESVSPSGK